MYDEVLGIWGVSSLDVVDVLHKNVKTRTQARVLDRKVGKDTSLRRPPSSLKVHCAMQPPGQAKSIHH